MDSEVLPRRAQIIDLIRQWFKERDFLEVDTPLMVKHPGMEPHLDPFVTELMSKDGSERERRYLITSPELAMKKLLGQDLERIFQLGKVFRNAEKGDTHSPEFTMLEWYRVGVGYQEMMEDTEQLIRFLVEALKIGGVFLQDWKRLSVREAFLQYAGMDLEELQEVGKLRETVSQKPYASSQHLDWDDLFFLVMLNEVEPALKDLGPVFLYDYPASQAALAKGRDDNSFWAERFELYIDGVELCNAFSELCDPTEQRERLQLEQDQRRQMRKEVFEVDEEFLQALENIDSAAGNALGVDRLIMLLLGKKQLSEVIF